MTGVYFYGDAPVLGGVEAFAGAEQATVFYLPGTNGWTDSYGGRPTVIWTPALELPAITSIVRGSGSITLSWTDFQINSNGYMIECSTDGVSWKIVPGRGNVTGQSAELPLAGEIRLLLRVRAR
jgi:hypothetical protein